MPAVADVPGACESMLDSMSTRLKLGLAASAIVLFALPPAASAQETTQPLSAKSPKISTSGVMSMAVTLPAGGTYAQTVISGRAVLCRIAKMTFNPGETKIAKCRLRQAIWKQFKAYADGGTSVTPPSDAAFTRLKGVAALRLTVMIFATTPAQEDAYGRYVELVCTREEQLAPTESNGLSTDSFFAQ